MSKGWGALMVSSWWITVICKTPRTRATQNEEDAVQPDTTFCGETRVPEGSPQAQPSIPQVSNDAPAEAVPSAVCGRRSLECGNSCFKPLIFGACLRSHFLNGFEFVAAHEIHVRHQLLQPLLHKCVDLVAHA